MTGSNKSERAKGQTLEAASKKSYWEKKKKPLKEKRVKARLFSSSNHDIPPFAGLFIHAGHALAGGEIDGAGAGRVSALSVDEMAAPTRPLTVLHTLSEGGG